MVGMVSLNHNILIKTSQRYSPVKVHMSAGHEESGF